MRACAEARAASGGGWVAVVNGTVQTCVLRSVAGLLSTQDASTVCRQVNAVNRVARQLGCPLPSPFGTLSTLALPVIPELRITDQGLFDVTRQEFVPL